MLTDWHLNLIRQRLLVLGYADKDIRYEGIQHMKSIDGKVAVVTGGASGIGKGIARSLKTAGARVIISDIEKGALEQAARDLGADWFSTDVSKAAEVKALAEYVLEEYGSVDILCNNAGVGPVAPIEHLSLDDWRWMIDINLWGVIHGVHSFLPIMKRNPGGGHIVNTSSMAGLMAGPTFGAYCVSKYGVVALTEVLFQELELEGSMVSASVLLPGPTQTAIATSSRNRPAKSDAALKDLDLRDVDLFGGTIPWKSADEVGQIVLEGILNRELYLFTHPDLMAPIKERFRQIESAAVRAASSQASESRRA